MLRKIIRGSLVPSNKEAASEPWNWQRFFSEFRANPSLLEAINYDKRWGGQHSEKDEYGYKWDAQEGLAFNTPTPAHNGSQDALDFINAISDYMASPESTLGMNGDIEIIIDTETLPLIFRVEAKDGKVSYQEIEYSWSEKVNV